MRNRELKILCLSALAAILTSVYAHAQVPTRLESKTDIAGGGRLHIRPGSSLIVFDKGGADAFFDVYTMLWNGSQRVCLTCGKPIPQMHIGNPEWHPSGAYILFQVQDPNLAFLPPEMEQFTFQMTSPGWGTNNNLWLMTADGSTFWQLTTVAPGMGTLHPHFDATGNRVTWAEKVGLAGVDQQWTIKVADLVWRDNVPSLANIVDLRPLGIDIFYETHEFSPDGGKIIFSAGYPSQTDLDIYTYDLLTGVVVNLTNSPGEWDEHSHYSPDRSKIVWASQRNITNPRAYFVPFLDYWIMNVDGSNKARLTYFNDPAAPEYHPNGAVAADFAFAGSLQWMIARLEQQRGPSAADGVMVTISVLKLKAAGTP